MPRNARGCGGQRRQSAKTKRYYCRSGATKQLIGAAQLLQEIDKAALVCPCRYRGTRVIHARLRRGSRSPQRVSRDSGSKSNGIGPFGIKLLRVCDLTTSIVSNCRAPRNKLLTGLNSAP